MVVSAPSRYQPTRQQRDPDSIELAQDCAVRIVRRKDKSASYREGAEVGWAGRDTLWMSIQLCQNVS